jgi:hypothetical protein
LGRNQKDAKFEDVVNENLGKINTRLEDVSGNMEKMEGRLNKLEAAKTGCSCAVA